MTELQQSLSTREGFMKRVKPPRGSSAAAGIVLLLAAVGVLWNARSSWATLREPDYSHLDLGFWEVFFDTVGGDPFWTVVVWAPVAVLPLAAAFFAYTLVTKRSHLAKLYERFLRGGYIAIASPLGITAQNGNNTVKVDLLTHPSLTEQQNAQVLGSVLAALPADKKSSVSLGKQLGKAGLAARVPVPVSQIFPGFPDGPLLTVHQRDAAIVLPPKKQGKRPEVVPVK